MSIYQIVSEADGSYSVHVENTGSLPGRYTGFKSKDDADQWIADQQTRPDLPPFFDKGGI
jgi:hypothetical protein